MDDRALKNTQKQKVPETFDLHVFFCEYSKKKQHIESN
jgi:hypothetical protein